jgi:hypothetical protein
MTIKFKRDNSIEGLGRMAGYIFSYLMFTTILYFLLVALKKMPGNWTYFHIALLSFCLSLSGEILKRLLR